MPQELWTVLSCPTEGVRFDTRTLELLDSDNDKRVRVPELLAGVNWACQRLARPSDLLKSSKTIPLDAFSDTPEGSALARLARRILDDIDAKEATSISSEHIRERDEKLANTPFNGDGVITPSAGGTPELEQTIKDILGTCEGVVDRCGELGIRQEEIDVFFQQAQDYLDWVDKGNAEAETIFPLKDGTAAASAAMAVVAEKIDDYFTRCRLATFDERAAEPLNSSEEDYTELASTNLNCATEELAAFPLASVKAGQSLRLDSSLNPYWHGAMMAFGANAVAPILGSGDSLSEKQWNTIKAKLQPYDTWMGSRTGEQVEPLGAERLREIVDGGAKAKLEELLERDKAFAAELDGLVDLDRLITYHSHLGRLLHNYVNLSDFYDDAYDAIFRVGRLYIDGRLCNLCVDVKDVDKHATLAESGKIFLAYCELSRPATAEKRMICAAVTAGFANSLWVGRNAIFYDRDNKDWEAVIVKMVESPISLKEAFWAPWIKIATMISEQIRKLLTARQDAMLDAASQNIETATTAAPDPGARPKMEGAALASSVAAIGIAVGLVGSAIGGVISAISGIPLWKTLLGIVAIFLAVSGPSVILAYFKLRARDLAPVLNACGWAVNTKIKITMRLGRRMTHEAALPPGSELDLEDPFAESKRGRRWTVIVLVVLALLFVLWRKEWLNDWLPEAWRYHAQNELTDLEEIESAAEVTEETPVENEE